MALMLAAGAAAEEDPAAAVLEQVRDAQGARPMLELSSSEVPRFDGGDVMTRASRTNLTLFPASRSAVGLLLGVTASSGPATGLLPSYVPGGAMLDLGLHWRHELDGTYRLDVTAWRRVGNVDAISLIQSRDPNYGARVEMSFTSGPLGPARKGFVAERGFVGVQLDNGARVTVKRSGGRPMVYYRSTF